MTDASKIPDPALHVFDQTNGVLGDDPAEDDQPTGRRASGTPKIGIPPIASL